MARRCNLGANHVADRAQLGRRAERRVWLLRGVCGHGPTFVVPDFVGAPAVVIKRGEARVVLAHQKDGLAGGQRHPISKRQNSRVEHVGREDEHEDVRLLDTRFHALLREVVLEHVEPRRARRDLAARERARARPAPSAWKCERKMCLRAGTGASGAAGRERVREDLRHRRPVVRVALQAPRDEVARARNSARRHQSWRAGRPIERHMHSWLCSAGSWMLSFDESRRNSTSRASIS